MLVSDVLLDLRYVSAGCEISECAGCEVSV